MQAKYNINGPLHKHVSNSAPVSWCCIAFKHKQVNARLVCACACVCVCACTRVEGWVRRNNPPGNNGSACLHTCQQVQTRHQYPQQGVSTKRTPAILRHRTHGAGHWQCVPTHLCCQLPCQSQARDPSQTRSSPGQAPPPTAVRLDPFLCRALRTPCRAVGNCRRARHPQEVAARWMNRDAGAGERPAAVTGLAPAVRGLAGERPAAVTGLATAVIGLAPAGPLTSSRTQHLHTVLKTNGACQHHQLFLTKCPRQHHQSLQTNNAYHHQCSKPTALVSTTSYSRPSALVSTTNRSRPTMHTTTNVPNQRRLSAPRGDGSATAPALRSGCGSVSLPRGCDLCARGAPPSCLLRRLCKLPKLPRV